jgi:hypothetical protein
MAEEGTVGSVGIRYIGGFLKVLPKQELGNEDKNHSCQKSTRKPDEPKMIIY